jgi:hypothetical protein
VVEVVVVVDEVVVVVVVVVVGGGVGEDPSMMTASARNMSANNQPARAVISKLGRLTSAVLRWN